MVSHCRTHHSYDVGIPGERGTIREDRDLTLRIRYGIVFGKMEGRYERC